MTDVDYLVVHAAFNAERRERIGHLGYWLGADRERFRIVKDTEGVGVWRATRAAWMAGLESDAEYLCVLQDDAVPCRNFSATVEAQIEAVGGRPLTMFLLRPQARRWPGIEQARWINLSSASGVATVLHRDTVTAWLDWSATFDAERKAAGQEVWPHMDDARLSMFLMTRGEPFWTHRVSAVDHSDSATTCPGVSGRGLEEAERVAYQWAEDGAAVDWAEGVSDPMQRTMRPGAFVRTLNSLGPVAQGRLGWASK